MLKIIKRLATQKRFFFIPNIVIVLLIGFVIRLYLSPFGTLRLDQGTFIAWSHRLLEVGFRGFYEGWSDYLPGYLYVLWLLAKVREFAPIPEVLLYKLPAILADLATGWLVYRLVSKIKSPKWGIGLAAFYLFNPSVLVNSSLWGQVDSLTVFFSLLAVYLMDFSWFVSAVCLAIGTLVKPQAAFVLPAVIYLMLKNKWRADKIIGYALVGALSFILAFWPFSNFGTLINFVWQRVITSLNQYPYNSVNAFNFWGLFGFWKSETGIVPMPLIGYTLVILSAVVLIVKNFKKTYGQYLIMAGLFLVSFLFLTRMHERHLLPALAPLLVSVTLIPDLFFVYWLLSFTYLANMFYAYQWVSFSFKEVFSPFLIKFFISLNVFGWLLFLYQVFTKNKTDYLLKLRIKVGDLLKAKGEINKALPTLLVKPKTLRLFLFGLLIFTAVSRFLFLGNPPKEYFDEVYHAFTARQMLHANRAAWEWWNTPPEGFAYEWTHPPLAKLGMWLGMILLGENAWGWRVPGAFLGVGTIILVYLIAKKLFQDEVLALLSALVLSVDGLALSMSRIGMNDTYLLFFILLTIYFFLKAKNFSSALAFGLALSSKWTAVYCLPVLVLIWLLRRNKWQISLGWFLVLPLAVYLLTYLPMFLSGHNLDIFWGMQKQMWWYHTRLSATHAYTSPAWSWPFLLRPVYLFTTEEVAGWVGRIYNLGNPAVFWFGVFSVLLSGVYCLVEKNKRLALVLFAYFIFFLPWIASPRIMFFYHYLPALPFLSILIGYTLRRNIFLLKYFWLVAFILFIYFYPHWTGINIPLWLDKSYYWLSSWR